MQFRTASTLLTICLIALVFDGTDATPTRPDNAPRQGGWLGNHRAYGQRLKESTEGRLGHHRAYGQRIKELEGTVINDTHFSKIVWSL